MAEQFDAEKTLLAEYRAAVEDIDHIGRNAIGGNGKFQYKYATLDKVLEAVQKTCKKHHCTMRQEIQDDEKLGAYIATIVFDDYAEKVVGRYPFQLGKPQDMGSAETYARRYSLYAAFDLYPGEDDDGAQAQQAAGGITEQQGQMLINLYRKKGLHVGEVMQSIGINVQRLRELTPEEWQILMKAGEQA